MTINELIKTAGLAKTRIDAGFSRVGRRLSTSAPVDRACMTLAARTVAMANALTLLCREGHANEALPLLRSIAGVVLSLRWIVDAESKERAEQELSEFRRSEWKNLWIEEPARERAVRFGIPLWALEETFDCAPDFILANPQGLPWGHLFSESQRTTHKAEKVLTAVIWWLALIVEALDLRWPGDFPGAAEMREAASISRG